MSSGAMEASYLVSAREGDNEREGGRSGAFCASRLGPGNLTHGAETLRRTQYSQVDCGSFSLYTHCFQLVKQPNNEGAYLSLSIAA